MTNWPNYGKWRHGKKRKELLETNIFTYPENVPAEIMNPIMEDVARQVANWEKAKKMNKEQIIDEAYENYKTEWMKENPPFAGPYTDKCLTQEEFINKWKTEAKDELIKVLYSQVMDLTMMSKIELGDDVISEIKRLKEIINE